MKFFFRVVNSHRQTNTSEMLNIDGFVSIEFIVIKKPVVGFFEQLLTEQVMWRLKLNGLTFETILQQNVTWLERPFNEVVR